MPVGVSVWTLRDVTPSFHPSKYQFSKILEFFNQSINVLQTLVVAIGAGLGVWGVVNLMEGYSNDNRAMRS